MANTLTNFSITNTDSDLFWRIIPGILRRFSVKDKDLTAPPGGEAEGDKYIPASVATGAWAGKEGTIAEYHTYSGGTIGWKFFTAPIGWMIYVVDETEIYVSTAALTWTAASSVIGGATHYYEKHTVTAGEAASGVIDLTGGNTYTTGDNSLCVYLNGQLQCITDDYAETDSNTITFVSGRLSEEDTIIFRWTK